MLLAAKDQRDEREVLRTKRGSRRPEEDASADKPGKCTSRVWIQLVQKGER